MRTQITGGALGICFALSLPFTLLAQPAESLRTDSIQEIVVAGSFIQARKQRTALSSEVLRQDFLQRHFTGNLVQTLAKIPGVQAMDIGAGSSKPMIRGLGFNRIAVVENSIKQEGQQWGADHGLEIDAFNIEGVEIVKGPSSLRYGSDALGGVVEILPPEMPAADQFFGAVTLLGKTVNGTFGGSLAAGLKRRGLCLRLRWSEQHFGDYRIPADTVVYLSQKMPVDGRLKNTAGYERDVSLSASLRTSRYRGEIAASNVHRKEGFFPGAHGVPDLRRLEDDGDRRNAELPYSRVNHLKISTHQQYAWDGVTLCGDFGYQLNHREEWSLFHTHYDSQPLPERNPDKELAFRLHTFSAAFRLRIARSAIWEHTAGWDGQMQRNGIGGYSFLLPAYHRFTTGGYWLTVWRPTGRLTLTGGVRYDRGGVDITPYEDPYLADYLHGRGYSEAEIARYRWRSYPVDRQFGDFSCSLGLVWAPSPEHLLKVNVGRSFRLPGANELAANGVHHGTFRHEQGDPSLRSEHGWQADAFYEFTAGPLRLTLSPFAALYDNYIFLRPTGGWSVLPHAGQIYRYTGARAVFAGGEAGAGIDIIRGLAYRLTGDYVYTFNRDAHTALSFSPPASMRHTLSWRRKCYDLFVECRHIAQQGRIARNEEPTSGATLLGAGASLRISVAGTEVCLSVSADNLLDTEYFNHLSFYRKIELPEPGRSFRILLNIPFKKSLK